MGLFVANPKLDEELLADPEVRQGLAESAEPARQMAEIFAEQARAPWMPRSGASSTVVVEEQDDGVWLINTDHAGHLMEWGSVNNPAHAPLRRGAQAAGLRLEETDRT